MDLKAIVLKFLEDTGHDGLFNRDGECACEKKDLAPCGEFSKECEAGYAAPAPEGSGYDFYIQKEKPKSGR